MSDKTKTPQSKEENVKYDLESRKVVISASLVSIVVVLSIFNQNVFSPRSEAPEIVRSGRMPQSVGSESQNSDWEYKLAKQMAQNETEWGSREPASLGQAPSPIDNFRFGLLENKYLFNFENGKVVSLRFPDQSPDRPKYIDDAKSFLSDNAKIFNIAFDHVKSASREPSGEFVRENLDLLDSQDQSVGRAVIVTDQYGRLLSVEISGL